MEMSKYGNVFVDSPRHNNTVSLYGGEASKSRRKWEKTLRHFGSARGRVREVLSQSSSDVSRRNRGTIRVQAFARSTKLPASPRPKIDSSAKNESYS
jgi:hypothetical protein